MEEEDDTIRITKIAATITIGVVLLLDVTTMTEAAAEIDEIWTIVVETMTATTDPIRVAVDETEIIDRIILEETKVGVDDAAARLAAVEVTRRILDLDDPVVSLLGHRRRTRRFPQPKVKRERPTTMIIRTQKINGPFLSLSWCNERPNETSKSTLASSTTSR